MFDNEIENENFKSSGPTMPPAMPTTEKRNKMRNLRKGRTLTYMTHDGQTRSGKVVAKDGDASLLHLRNGTYRWAIPCMIHSILPAKGKSR